MKKVKNLIFDLGGVVLTDDDTGVLFNNEELKKRVNFDQEKFNSAWRKHWPDVGEKRLTVIDFYNKVQKDALGSIDGHLSKFMFEEYKRTSHQLKAYGLLSTFEKECSIYAITNIFAEGLEFKRNKFNLDEYFDLIVASCDLGFSKPNPEIFKFLINKTNIKPSESLFIDDREKNIKAAEDLGFNVFLYNDSDFEKFKKELDKFEIKYE